MADKFMKAYRRTLDGIVVTVACPSSGGFEIDFNGEVIAQTSTKNAAQKIIKHNALGARGDVYNDWSQPTFHRVAGDYDRRI